MLASIVTSSFEDRLMSLSSSRPSNNPSDIEVSMLFEMIMCVRDFSPKNSFVSRDLSWFELRLILDTFRPRNVRGSSDSNSFPKNDRLE